MKTLSIDQAAQELATLVCRVNQSSVPISIFGEDGPLAVLVSHNEWNAIMETLHLSSVPGMIESIRQADATPQSEWREYTEDEKW